MMTSALDAVLKTKDPQSVARLFQGLSEKERKVHATRALEWSRVLTAVAQSDSQIFKVFERFGNRAPKAVQAVRSVLEQVKNGEITVPREALQLDALDATRTAVLATCGLPDVKKSGLPPLDIAFEVIKDRRPKWLNRWLVLVCSECPMEGWIKVRQFEIAEHVEAERTTEFWRGMICSLGRSRESVVEALTSDRELVDTYLWQLFEDAESARYLAEPGEIVTEYMQQFRTARRQLAEPKQLSRFDYQVLSRVSQSWREALSELVRAGVISRDKLSSAVFETLTHISADATSKAGHGETPSTAGWWISIHEAMELSQSEQEKLCSRYIGLLATKDAEVLSWSLNHLAAMRPESLSTNSLLANIGNVFLNKRKEPALAALKLLSLLWDAAPASKDALAEVTLDAINHPSGDVQTRALDLLAKRHGLDDERVARELRQRAELLSGLVKQKALKLTDHVAPASTDNLDEVASCDVEDLRARCRAIDAGLATAAGLSDSLAALDNGQIPRCLSLLDAAIPRLDPEKVIKPIANLDDLIYVYLHVLEGKAKADDVERLLDGVMRLCGERPADFDSRVSSLRKKISDRLDPRPGSTLTVSRPFTGLEYRDDLAALGRAWLDENPKSSGMGNMLAGALSALFSSTATAISPGNTTMAFFSERVYAVARYIVERRPAPLLAAPTHEGGWIDPRVLVQRVEIWRKTDQRLMISDFVQALLRLAPEHRSAALALMPPGDDEYTATLRYALGDGVSGPMKTAELWVAAFRARQPLGTSDLLRKKFSDIGPDCMVQANYRPALAEFAESPGGVFAGMFGTPTPLLVAEPVLVPHPTMKLFPTALMHSRGQELTNVFSLELMLPLNREAFFAYHTNRMMHFLESSGTYWQGSWEPLFDPDVPTCGNARWLLALALSAKQPEAARLALDALIASIDDNRLDGQAFGEVMGQLLPTGKITLARWLRALKEILRISPVHCQFVRQAIEECIVVATITDVATPQMPPSKGTVRYLKSAGVTEKTSEPKTVGFVPPVQLLDLLYEACTASGDGIGSKARQVLDGPLRKGKGKTAKIIQLLLDMQGKDFAKSACGNTLASHVLAMRVERVERWQRWIDASKDTKPIECVTATVL